MKELVPGWGTTGPHLWNYLFLNVSYCVGKCCHKCHAYFSEKKKVTADCQNKTIACKKLWFFCVELWINGVFFKMADLNQNFTILKSFNKTMLLIIGIEGKRDLGIGVFKSRTATIGETNTEKFQHSRVCLTWRQRTMLLFCCQFCFKPLSGWIILSQCLW